MLNYNNFYDLLIITYLYLFVYNVSLIIFFWTLLQFINFNLKTIYSFIDYKFNIFFITVLAILLFSIAGVPPFIGFFSKLLILILLINSNFFFFYIFFFCLLFFGLYFYLQNIRFLYSTGYGNLNYSYVKNLRLSFFFFYLTYTILFFLVFGFFFFDDLFFFFFWLLN